MRFFENELELEYGDINDILQSKLDDIKEYHPNIIVGISRGGIIPAVRLSYLLNLPLETISVNVDHKVQYNAYITDLLNKGNRVLLVDDINNTGNTIKQVYDMYKGNDDLVRTFVLIEKMNNVFKCHYSGIRIDDSRWIHFEDEHYDNDTKKTY